MELEGTIFLLAGNRTFRFPAGKTEDSMPWQENRKTPWRQGMLSKKAGKSQIL
jgi:hypothetical protein